MKNSGRFIVFTSEWQVTRKIYLTVQKAKQEYALIKSTFVFVFN